MSLWGKGDSGSKPKFLPESELGNVEFIDQEESKLPYNQSRGVKTPGWVKTITYTDSQGKQRIKTEVLVSLSVSASSTGDAFRLVIDNSIISIDGHTILIN